ncbi:MAG: radical SAM protein [Desulfobacterales bacterium]|jgi:pyruvate-formate lyase-activating enzyme|nr:radical SAM protein [Desulfobacterales bacterium]
MKHPKYCLVYADEKENVYDFPAKEPLFRTGNRLVPVSLDDLIPLPFGSYLYYLPGRHPVSYDRQRKTISTVKHGPDGGKIWAVSAFAASAYLRTFLPAFKKIKDAPVLPLWAYCGVVFMNDIFYVPAIRIDDDPRSDPAIHQNDQALSSAIRKFKKHFPQNRLVRQLAVCSTRYGCLCARNFFLRRYEAPIPTSPACNSGCIGCLSFQNKESGFIAPQPRLKFKPSPEEISEVICSHFSKVETPVASFGQGCEGEPLLRAEDIVRAIRLVRRQTDRGTININTNGSDPAAVKKLIEAGLDSIRISLNSPTEFYYNRYHQPENYTYNDVVKSISVALEKNIFVSVNLFFMPGFTDMRSEVESLFRLLDKFPVNMIQTRNMNIDPDFYFESIGYIESEPLGIARLIGIIKEKYPAIRLGYYNPPKETFHQKADSGSK